MSRSFVAPYKLPFNYSNRIEYVIRTAHCALQTLNAK